MKTIIILGVIFIALVINWSNKLDEKREQAYEGCSYTEDYQVICK